jgi:hypothetical protein
VRKTFMGHECIALTDIDCRRLKTAGSLKRLER